MDLWQLKKMMFERIIVNCMIFEDFQVLEQGVAPRQYSIDLTLKEQFG